MRPVRFHPSWLQNLFARQKIATMEELKRALGTNVDMTVLRKLRPLGYLTSYSHRGKFYTLQGLVRFDERGLFHVRDVGFSRFGSLLDTAEQFVVRSSAGYYTTELNRELGVETKEALLTLVRRRRVVREAFQGLYLHCAPDPQLRRVQLVNRKRGGEPGGVAARVEVQMAAEAKAALLLFFSTLNERQRRLYAGMESLRLGHGGDRWIAELTGLDVHTVARGRRELLAQDLELDGIRREGGGRPAVEKKRRK